MPATSQKSRFMSTVAWPDGLTWMAVSSTSRSRNGGITPIAAEKRIRPQAAASFALYRLNSVTIRRTFALRTAGSAGRTGGSRLADSQRRPGTSRVCLRRGLPGELRERLDRRADPRGQLPRRRDRRRRRLDADGLADDDTNAGAPRDARPGPERTVGADDPHGDDGRTGGEREPRGPAVPGALRRFPAPSPAGRSRPRRRLAAHPTRRPTRRGRRGRGARGSLRDRRECDRRCGSPRAPPWRGTGGGGRRPSEEERISEGVVVRDDEQGPGGSGGPSARAPQTARIRGATTTCKAP